MLDLTTEDLIVAIKAISPEYPRFESDMRADRVSLYHHLWLELDWREQRRLLMIERFEKIAAIRQRIEREESDRRAAMRAQAGQYSAADEMIMGILNELIAE